MRKIIEVNGNELWPMLNILNEVCNGIKINSFEKKVKRDSLFALIEKITAYEEEDDKLETIIYIELDNHEIDAIINCFNEVLKQIEDWEFSTRIGITIEEASKIKEKLQLSLLTSS